MIRSGLSAETEGIADYLQSVNAVLSDTFRLDYKYRNLHHRNETEPSPKGGKRFYLSNSTISRNTSRTRVVSCNRGPWSCFFFGRRSPPLDSQDSVRLQVWKSCWPDFHPGNDRILSECSNHGMLAMLAVSDRAYCPCLWASRALLRMTIAMFTRTSAKLKT
jgi:hypothetical protein